jgi:hypothetical protein
VNDFLKMGESSILGDSARWNFLVGEQLRTVSSNKQVKVFKNFTVNYLLFQKGILKEQKSIKNRPTAKDKIIIGYPSLFKPSYSQL